MLNIGSKITELRKQNKWSQAELAKAVNASRDIIGKYERNENAPSIEMAQKMADVFGVSLDYLVGGGVNAHFDKKTLQRIQELELLEEDKRKTLFDLMDTYIRDAKTRQAYASR